MEQKDWQLQGTQKDSQSVTPDWGKVNQVLIDGVILKEVRHVPTGYGHLTELFRADWGLKENFAQAFQSCLHPGAISAWHAHADTQDCLFVNRGMLKVVLYDARQDSKTFGKISEFLLGDLRPGILVIPPKVWHGIRNVGSTEASLINFVDHAYDYEDPDHWRLDPHSPEIPYKLA